MKPHAPLEYRGPFQPIATSAPGVMLSEHLPLLAKQAHHIALINSVGGTVNTNDHHAGYYYNLTGHVPDPSFLIKGNNRTPYPDDWPYMGCVVASKSPQQGGMPNAISLPYKPSQLPYTRPGQFAAKLGVKHDPLYVYGTREKPTEFRVPDLVLSNDVTASRFGKRQDLQSRLNEARRDLDRVAAVGTWTSQQDRALSLLSSATTSSAFDVARESPETLARYGNTLNGMSLLAARRLVEAGVPFVTLHHGGWDHHTNLFSSLKKLLPSFEASIATLIDDLHQRGMLETTMVIVLGEFGRTPQINKDAGRDHWSNAMSVLFAGGGTPGSQCIGATDAKGFAAVERILAPENFVSTVYSKLGIDPGKVVYAPNGRPSHLVSEPTPIAELMG